MNIRKIKEIKHLLPQDCWIVMRNKVNNNEMDEELVWHIEGDFTTTNLNLDAPFTSFKHHFEGDEIHLEQESLLLILIEGNLTADNIYNNETDGSTCLMVLGNATVNNVVVGGQEIYIAQNLTVNECFWGHYNHGDLVVSGHIKAKVFIATEEYHFPYHQEILAEYFINDDSEEAPYEPALSTGIFKPELLSELDPVDAEDIFSFSEWIDRQAVVAHLAAGKEILQNEIMILSQATQQQQLLEAIPKQFGNPLFTKDAEFQLQIPNFKKLFEIARLHQQDAEQVFEWNGYSITLSCQTKGDEVDYILAEHTAGLIFYIERRETNGGFFKRTTESLNAVFKAPPEQDFISVFENQTPQEVLTALQELWTEILIHTERGLYFYQQFLTTVKCTDLLELLATPVVQEKYNDYWNIDKSGFWYGNYSISVRIHGAKDLPGSVDIGKEIKSDDFDTRKYYFRLNQVNQPTFPVLYYNSSQEKQTTDRYRNHSNLAQVFLYDWAYYQEALEWYPKVRSAIEEQNKLYAEEKENSLKHQQSIAKKKSQPNPPPFNEMEFEGVTFKVINLADADALIGDLTDFKGNKIYNVYEDTWRFPSDEDNCFFLLAEEDVVIEKLDLDYNTETVSDIYILGFIFLKNLKTTQYILAFDTDNSPALIVLGGVETVNLHLFGNIHYIGNGLQCDTLWGVYNHGELFIKGITTAWLVYADDMDLHIEKFGALGAAISNEGLSIMLNSILKDTDGSTLNVENYLPSTHKLSDIVLSDYIEVNEQGTEILNNHAFKAVKNGLSLIDHNKKARFEYVDFPKRLKEMFKQLASLNEVKTNQVITNSRKNQYIFSLFTHEGADYQQLAVLIGRSYAIRMRALLHLLDGDVLLLLEYLDENNAVKYHWPDHLESNTLEMKCVKKAMIDAYEALINN